MAECPNVKTNKEQCRCPYDDCERHGVCCECVRYHREQGQKPMCLK